MNQSKIGYGVNHTVTKPNVNGSADIQELICSIKIAHEKGALFFLAVQLAPLLEEYYEQNGSPTAVELETLLAQATRIM